METHSVLSLVTQIMTMLQFWMQGDLWLSTGLQSETLLVVGRQQFCALIGYSNYDHAAVLDARRSVTEYGFTIGNSLGSWKETIHPTMTYPLQRKSTWLWQKQRRKGSSWRVWLSILGVNKKKASIFYDRLSAIGLAKDQVHHERTKNIDNDCRIAPKK